MTETRAITGHNRDVWNGVAEQRRANCPPPDFFTDGGSTLDPEEAAALGDVVGKQVLNLQCSSGNEALSIAAMGASVTGVDISDVAIRIAREQAGASGLDATFLAADVYALPPHLQAEDFDIVYSSAGIVCWLPDLPEWGRIVARALRPGGSFVLEEHHPIWEIAAVAGDLVRISGTYFGRQQPNPPGPFDPQRSVHAAGEPIEMAGTTFTWPLGDIVTALAGAGLRILSLTEQPIVEMYAPDGASAGERDLAGRLPAAYLLVAGKD